MNKIIKRLWTKGTPGEFKKVAVDMPHGLGDQIMCFPLLASLKEHIKDIHISVITYNKMSRDFLTYNKNVDNIIEIDAEFSLKGLIFFLVHKLSRVRKIFRKEKFDLLILIHPNPLRDILYFFLPSRSKVYNKQNIHKFKEVTAILEYLKIPVKIDYSVDLPIDSSILKEHNLKSKNYIVIDLYAQYTDRDPRQWNKFNELINKLKTKTNKKIVLAGINNTHNTISGVVDLVNRTNFNGLLNLISNASAVISMDTFFFHLSYCLNTPVVSLFGPVNPEDRIPMEKKLKYHTIYKKQDCSPCIKNKVLINCKNKYKCMDEITIDEVMNALNEYL